MKNFICHQPKQSTLWPLATVSFAGTYPASRTIAGMLTSETSINAVRGNDKGQMEFEGVDG